jgi:hypothetical protein
MKSTRKQLLVTPMKSYKLIFIILFTGISLASCRPASPPSALPNTHPANITYPEGLDKPDLSENELRLISDKIYNNETLSNPDKLIVWNESENFVSLGIGHFIWYPEGVEKRFDETFPAVIDYLETHQVRLPIWLLNARNTGAPWASKALFEEAKNDPEMRELKRILSNTRDLQTAFFLDRTYKAIPEIIKLAPAKDRQHVINSYHAVANSPGGWYPLIDYINFKGKGTKTSERYNGKGWGLLQVLQEMRPVLPGPDALNEFARATQAVLERRVKNSPYGNNEERWLAGWRNRTFTYKQPLVQ